MVETGLFTLRYQTFTMAIISNHDDINFLVYGSLTVPEAACCANPDLGRQNQFFSHFVLKLKPLLLVRVRVYPLPEVPSNLAGYNVLLPCH